MDFVLQCRSFHGTMSSLGKKKWNTKLSSAGLVYLHFGRKILYQEIGDNTDEKTIEIVFDKVYEHFIEEIDAIDNGINQYDGEERFVSFCPPKN